MNKGLKLAVGTGVAISVLGSTPLVTEAYLVDPGTGNVYIPDDPVGGTKPTNPGGSGGSGGSGNSGNSGGTNTNPGNGSGGNSGGSRDSTGNSGSFRSEFITDQTNAVEPMNKEETLARINNADPQRKRFYEQVITKLDKKAGNLLYKISEQGFTYYSPIRPKRDSQGGVSTLEYSFENFYTKKYYDNPSSSDAWLNHLWTVNTDITHNFKEVKANIAMQTKAVSKKDMAKIGVGVLPSYDMNWGGNFKGEVGEWRFSGYVPDGASMMNHEFPADYTFTGVTKARWDNYEDYGNRLFAQTSYDGPRWKSAKRELVKRLLDQNPDMKFKTIDQWMKILSLQTQPEKNPLTGQRDGKYGGATFNAYNGNGRYYQSFVLLGEEKHGTQNLVLTKLVITENEKDSNGNYPVVATISRKEWETHKTVDEKILGQLVPGKTYRVVSTVQNANKLNNTKHNPTTTDVGYAINYDKKKLETDGYYNPQYDKETKKATNKGTIGKNSSVTTVTTFKMPDNLKAASNVRFGSVIADVHQAAGDNLNYVDDDLMLVVPVATGNITATGVALVDENGKEVSNPLPGHQYKIRYKFKYTGATQKTKTKITINYQNVRKLPDGNTETILYKDGKTNQKDTVVSQDLILVNGKSYSMDTKYYEWYELPYIETTATLSSDAPGLNTNTKDDKFSKTWNETYDYSIENLQVVARTERGDVATDGKQHYGVSFTVNNTMPQAAVKDNYAKDVNIRITLGGKTQVITEHLVAGKNKDIVVDIALDKAVKPGSVVNAKVEVNYDKGAYEYGIGTANNTATTKVDTSNFTKDPVTGAITNPSNTNANTGAYVADPVDPNKFTSVTKANNENRWTQKYAVESWKAKKITYTGLNGKKTYTFYRYTPVSDTVKTVSQQESYRILDVLMKSKVTTDKNWGNNGWVSMVNEPGKAQIKAGYGYQLKLIVEYNTNAFSTEPRAVRNQDGSGTSVRPQNVMPNLSKDVYFQTSDGKILSASGINSTHRVFVPKILEQTKEKLVVEYTLQDTYALGIRTPGRIYVEENTPNGVYNVRAWTPMINGVPTKNKNTVSNGFTLYTPAPLVDILGGIVSNTPKPLPTLGRDDDGNLIVDTSKIPSMSIVVIGSAKDDLVNSVVQ